MTQKQNIGVNNINRGVYTFVKESRMWYNGSTVSEGLAELKNGSMKMLELNIQRIQEEISRLEAIQDINIDDLTTLQLLQIRLEKFREMKTKDDMLRKELS